MQSSPTNRSPYVPLVSEVEITALKEARAHYQDRSVVEAAIESLEGLRSASVAMLSAMLSKAGMEISVADAPKAEIPHVSTEALHRHVGKFRADRKQG